jgi:outer membrane protein assembly factor BamD
MLKTRTFLLGLLSLAFATSMAHATLVWRAGEGWSDESGGDVSASSSRDQLEQAHKLEAQGARDEALKAYKGLLRRWPLSFFAPEAQYRTGKILEDEADFNEAFSAFQKMVQKYPSSDFFSQALNEQYRIANLYLAGEPQRIWKIPVGPSMVKTIEMYQRIIKNAPYGDYAPQCQFNIGLANEKQRKYTDAVEAYQTVLDNYPTSSIAPNAQYQIGYAWMRSCQSGDYDIGAAKKATDAFQDYLVRYPNADKVDQAQEDIKSLGQRQTQGAYDVAKFYETQHDTRAAFIYYNEVVREDPNSFQAQQAKRRIQELRPAVEALPGGLGPDGSGNPAVPLAQRVASGQPPETPGGPGPSGAPADDQSSQPPANPQGTDSAPDQPMPNAAPPDATAATVPADPNAPVTSSSPGETAAAPAASSTSTPPVAQPASQPASAPVAQPVSSTSVKSHPSQ